MLNHPVNIKRFFNAIELPAYSKTDIIEICKGKYSNLDDIMIECLVDIYQIVVSHNNRYNVEDFDSLTIKSNNFNSHFDLRNFFKFCRRISHIIFKIETSSQDKSSLYIFFHAYDCFVAHMQDLDKKTEYSNLIGARLNIDAKKIEHYLTVYKPLLIIEPDTIRCDIGASVIPRNNFGYSKTVYYNHNTSKRQKVASFPQKNFEKNADAEIGFINNIAKPKDLIEPSQSLQKNLKYNFYLTKQACNTLRCAIEAIALNEPLLLVGETGGGKTSLIQYLADTIYPQEYSEKESNGTKGLDIYDYSNKAKLVVINLSNQTEIEDLYGCYRPRTLGGHGIQNSKVIKSNEDNTPDTKDLEMSSRLYYEDLLLNRESIRRFEVLFVSTFSITKNKAFFGNFKRLLVSSNHNEPKWREAYHMMTFSCDKAEQKLKRDCERLEKELKDEAKMKSDNDDNVESSVENDLTDNKLKCLRRLAIEWRRFLSRLHRLKNYIDNMKKNKGSNPTIFSFIEGILLRAFKRGHWVLLDEINLASDETLHSLFSILEENKIFTIDNNNTNCSEQLNLNQSQADYDANVDQFSVNAHPNFRLFACMNPPSKIESQKRSLDPRLRNRFTEVYIADLEDRADLRLIIDSYLSRGATGNAKKQNNLLTKRMIENMIDFYLAIRKSVTDKSLFKINHKLINIASQSLPPAYTLRSLCRTIQLVSQCWQNKNLYMTPYNKSLNDIVYEAFMTVFSSELDKEYLPNLKSLFKTTLFNGYDFEKLYKRMEKNSFSLSNTPFIDHTKNQPSTAKIDGYLSIANYYLLKGDAENVFDKKFIFTPSVQCYLSSIVRALHYRRFPILLQGPTSVGKTSLITWLAKYLGIICVRINNHDSTEIADYVGRYRYDPQMDSFYFQEGPLTTAMKKGHWVILDELNLAPSEVLEALNRVLDDNRELINPAFSENQNCNEETIKAHERFTIFATQNPASAIYSGRKQLSRAFRNRFLQVNFSLLPYEEIKVILRESWHLSTKTCDKMVAIMMDLQCKRSKNSVFFGKEGFITIRDLFKWANRYDTLVGGDDEITNLLRREWNLNLLALTGYTLLASRCRTQEDLCIINDIFNRIFNEHKSSVYNISDMENYLFNSETELFTTLKTRIIENFREFDHIHWTFNTRRILILTYLSAYFKEPVLLVGQTGCGKTTICQIIADLFKQTCYTINCHQQSDASDFVGSLRPCHDSDEQQAMSTDYVNNDLKAPKGTVHMKNLGEPKGEEHMEIDLDAKFVNTLEYHVESDPPKDSKSKKMFEWRDGLLVKAMKEGNSLLLDEISLADNSVLERLNSVLEADKKLVLIEKGNETYDSCMEIKAHHDFHLFATMNPGGDYGKKELSPALRNRFTEIWCDSNDDIKDVVGIITHNLKSARVENTNSLIIKAFVEYYDWIKNFNNSSPKNKASWFSGEFSSLTTLPSINLNTRDVLRFTQFMNSATFEANINNFCPSNSIMDINLENLAVNSFTNCNLIVEQIKRFYHSVALTLWEKIDIAAFLNNLPSHQITSIQEMCHSRLLNSIFHIYEEISLLNHIERGVFDNANELIFQSSHMEIVKNSKVFGITPFVYHITNPDHIMDSSSNFVLHAPTARENMFKILRALTLSKPMLLEGSPGVGKTTLIQALANFTNNKLVRINLSEHTDVCDLFGANLPTNDGSFAWKDGPVLKVLKNGYWLLIDEINLASQSVLEALNSCLDHRGIVTIPELGRSFSIKEGKTVIFACQNPHFQGGGRKVLPKSFVNRFIHVYIRDMNPQDYIIILKHSYPNIPEDVIADMVAINFEVKRLSKELTRYSNMWEFNIRDLTRWCQLSLKNSKYQEDLLYDSFDLIYIARFRNPQHKIAISTIFFRISNHENPLRKIDEKNSGLPSSHYKMIQTPFHFSRTTSASSNLQIGRSLLKIANKLSVDFLCGNNYNKPLCLLKSQMKNLELLARVLQMNWMPILIGNTGSGKTSLVRILASLSGNKLSHFYMHPNTDTTDLIGNYEQNDSLSVIGKLINLYELLLRKMANHYILTEEDCQRKIVLDLLQNLSQYSLNLFSPANSANASLPSIFIEIMDYFQDLPLNSPIVTQLKYKDYIKEAERLLRSLNNILTLNPTNNESGQTFNWIDSLLVQALKDGSWILIENANLCSPAILDRLMPLLEPNGYLEIPERGFVDGSHVYIVKPHSDCRIIMTMNLSNGEISRAMNNRGVEIYLDDITSDGAESDIISILSSHDFPPIISETLYRFHKHFCETFLKLATNQPSIFDLINLVINIENRIGSCKIDIGSVIINTFLDFYQPYMNRNDTNLSSKLEQFRMNLWDIMENAWNSQSHSQPIDNLISLNFADNPQHDNKYNVVNIETNARTGNEYTNYDSFAKLFDNQTIHLSFDIRNDVYYNTIPFLTTQERCSFISGMDLRSILFNAQPLVSNYVENILDNAPRILKTSSVYLFPVTPWSNSARNNVKTINTLRLLVDFTSRPSLNPSLYYINRILTHHKSLHNNNKHTECFFDIESNYRFIIEYLTLFNSRPNQLLFGNIKNEEIDPRWNSVLYAEPKNDKNLNNHLNTFNIMKEILLLKTYVESSHLYTTYKSHIKDIELYIIDLSGIEDFHRLINLVNYDYTKLFCVISYFCLSWIENIFGAMSTESFTILEMNDESYIQFINLFWTLWYMVQVIDNFCDTHLFTNTILLEQDFYIILTYFMGMIWERVQGQIDYFSKTNWSSNPINEDLIISPRTTQSFLLLDKILRLGLDKQRNSYFYCFYWQIYSRDTKALCLLQNPNYENQLTTEKDLTNKDSNIIDNLSCDGFDFVEVLKRYFELNLGFEKKLTPVPHLSQNNYFENKSYQPSFYDNSQCWNLALKNNIIEAYVNRCLFSKTKHILDDNQLECSQGMDYHTASSLLMIHNNHRQYLYRHNKNLSLDVPGNDNTSDFIETDLGKLLESKFDFVDSCLNTLHKDITTNALTYLSQTLTICKSLNIDVRSSNDLLDMINSYLTPNFEHSYIYSLLSHINNILIDNFSNTNSPKCFDDMHLNNNKVEQTLQIMGIISQSALVLISTYYLRQKFVIPDIVLDPLLELAMRRKIIADELTSINDEIRMRRKHHESLNLCLVSGAFKAEIDLNDEGLDEHFLNLDHVHPRYSYLKQQRETLKRLLSELDEETDINIENIRSDRENFLAFQREIQRFISSIITHQKLLDISRYAQNLSKIIFHFNPSLSEQENHIQNMVLKFDSHINPSLTSMKTNIMDFIVKFGRSYTSYSDLWTPFVNSLVMVHRGLRGVQYTTSYFVKYLKARYKMTFWELVFSNMSFFPHTENNDILHIESVYFPSSLYLNLICGLELRKVLCGNGKISEITGVFIHLKYLFWTILSMHHHQQPIIQSTKRNNIKSLSKLIPLPSTSVWDKILDIFADLRQKLKPYVVDYDLEWFIAKDGETDIYTDKENDRILKLLESGEVESQIFLIDETSKEIRGKNDAVAAPNEKIMKSLLKNNLLPYIHSFLTVFTNIYGTNKTSERDPDIYYMSSSYYHHLTYNLINSAFYYSLKKGGGRLNDFISPLQDRYLLSNHLVHYKSSTFNSYHPNSNSDAINPFVSEYPSATNIITSNLNAISTYLSNVLNSADHYTQNHPHVTELFALMAKLTGCKAEVESKTSFSNYLLITENLIKCFETYENSIASSTPQLSLIKHRNILCIHFSKAQNAFIDSLNQWIRIIENEISKLSDLYFFDFYQEIKAIFVADDTGEELRSNVEEDRKKLLALIYDYLIKSPVGQFEKRITLIESLFHYFNLEYSNQAAVFHPSFKYLEAVVIHFKTFVPIIKNHLQSNTPAYEKELKHALNVHRKKLNDGLEFKLLIKSLYPKLKKIRESYQTILLASVKDKIISSPSPPNDLLLIRPIQLINIYLPIIENNHEFAQILDTNNLKFKKTIFGISEVFDVKIARKLDIFEPYNALISDLTKNVSEVNYLVIQSKRIFEGTKELAFDLRHKNKLLIDLYKSFYATGISYAKGLTLCNKNSALFRYPFIELFVTYAIFEDNENVEYGFVKQLRDGLSSSDNIFHLALRNVFNFHELILTDSAKDIDRIHMVRCHGIMDYLFFAVSRQRQNLDRIINDILRMKVLHDKVNDWFYVPRLAYCYEHFSEDFYNILRKFNQLCLNVSNTIDRLCIILSDAKTKSDFEVYASAIKGLTRQSAAMINIELDINLHPLKNEDRIDNNLIKTSAIITKNQINFLKNGLTYLSRNFNTFLSNLLAKNNNSEKIENGGVDSMILKSPLISCDVMGSYTQQFFALQNEFETFSSTYCIENSPKIEEENILLADDFLEPNSENDDLSERLIRNRFLQIWHHKLNKMALFMENSEVAKHLNILDSNKVDNQTSNSSSCALQMIPFVEGIFSQLLDIFDFSKLLTNLNTSYWNYHEDKFILSFTINAIIEKSYMVAQRYFNFHLSILNLFNLSSELFYGFIQKGYGSKLKQPTDNSDKSVVNNNPNPKQQDGTEEIADSENCGMGEGQGLKNVSDQMENLDQIEGSTQKEEFMDDKYETKDKSSKDEMADFDDEAIELPNEIEDDYKDDDQFDYEKNFANDIDDPQNVDDLKNEWDASDPNISNPDTDLIPPSNATNEFDESSLKEAIKEQLKRNDDLEKKNSSNPENSKGKRTEIDQKIGQKLESVKESEEHKGEDLDNTETMTEDDLGGDTNDEEFNKANEENGNEVDRETGAKNSTQLEAATSGQEKTFDNEQNNLEENDARFEAKKEGEEANDIDDLDQNLESKKLNNEIFDLDDDLDDEEESHSLDPNLNHLLEPLSLNEESLISDADEKNIDQDDGGIKDVDDSVDLDHPEIQKINPQASEFEDLYLNDMKDEEIEKNASENVSPVNDDNNAQNGMDGGRVSKDEMPGPNSHGKDKNSADNMIEDGGDSSEGNASLIDATTGKKNKTRSNNRRQRKKKKMRKQNLPLPSQTENRENEPNKKSADDDIIEILDDDIRDGAIDAENKISKFEMDEKTVYHKPEHNDDLGDEDGEEMTNTLEKKLQKNNSDSFTPGAKSKILNPSHDEIIDLTQEDSNPQADIEEIGEEKIIKNTPRSPKDYSNDKNDDVNRRAKFIESLREEEDRKKCSEKNLGDDLENLEEMATNVLVSTYYDKVDLYDQQMETGLEENKSNEMDFGLMDLNKSIALEDSDKNKDIIELYDENSNFEAQQLCEQLKIILEPTTASRYKGDYKTGKRLNMKKIVDYIASDYRNNKIWMRKTKLAKRDYNIIIALDDSTSMKDNMSREMAVKALSIINKAFSLLEIGNLCICKFGREVQIMQPFNRKLTEHEMIQALRQHLTFDQINTDFPALLEFVQQYFDQNNRLKGVNRNVNNENLLFVISDGRGVFGNGMDNIRNSVSSLLFNNIFSVFIILDNPRNKNSICDIKIPFFSNTSEIPEIKSYLEFFPFPFYIIAKDIEALLTVFPEALKQWFEMIVSRRS
ncbi:midasin-like [Gordionus sp. m RMFG-2023]|uniref:midasin-like n=1 Tax=Gordionus sp. m RMFG-2023 TaxID=3053472 RepID=UPI0031FE393C